MRLLIKTKIYPVMALLLFLTPIMASAAQKEQIVAAHYAPWFRGPGVGNGWYSLVGYKVVKTAYKPQLGYYNNLDPTVLNKHITWAKKYGINTFMIEWNGQGTYDFYSPLDISMQSFIQNPNFKNIDYFFVYSLVSALGQPGDPPLTPINLNHSRVINKLLDDFRYACRTYMKRSHYLRINSRPVVYLWSVPLANGDLKKAMNKLRDVIKTETGKNPYLVADVVAMYTDPVPAKIAPFDAVMPYVMLEVNGSPPKSYALADSVENIVSRYRYFYYVCKDLDIDFVPAVFPGFDAEGAPWCYDASGRVSTPRVDRAKPWFKDLIRGAKSYVDPDVNMLYITSWSEWNEGTNIEPSVQHKFKLLEGLKLGLEQQATEMPVLDRIRFKFSRVVDAPGNDSRLLGAAFQKVEFLDANLNPMLSLDIGTDQVRDFMGWGWYSNEHEPPNGATFCWAGQAQKFATLHINVPWDAKYLKIIMRPVDYQKTTVHINSRWITELPTLHPYTWAQHIIPLHFQ
jgi:hypothetical protein